MVQPHEPAILDVGTGGRVHGLRSSQPLGGAAALHDSRATDPSQGDRCEGFLA